jgi:hypothetical protein
MSLNSACNCCDNPLITIIGRSPNNINWAGGIQNVAVMVAPKFYSNESYPPFEEYCVPEGQEPPEPPEFLSGQFWPTNESYASYIVGSDNDAGPQFNKIKYRISHQPTTSCYLKIWFRKGTNQLYPNSLVEATFESLFQYTWNGNGSPCFTDPSKPFYACENIVYGDEFELLPTEGVVHWINWKYSIIQGYEPDWQEYDNDGNLLERCNPDGVPNPSSCI